MSRGIYPNLPLHTVRAIITVTTCTTESTHVCGFFVSCDEVIVGDVDEVETGANSDNALFQASIST